MRAKRVRTIAAVVIRVATRVAFYLLVLSVMILAICTLAVLADVVQGRLWFFKLLLNVCAAATSVAVALEVVVLVAGLVMAPVVMLDAKRRTRLIFERKMVRMRDL